MHKKIIIASLLVALALPCYVVLADDTTTTTTATTVDCGSAPTLPTAPATGATAQERQQYRTQMQQYRQDMQRYNQCKRGQFKGERQNIKDQKQQNAQAHCDLINQRITERLNNFQSKQNGDETIFGNIYQRLTNIATRLKGDNLDTTKLTADLATLKMKIDKVNTDYASVISALKETQGLTCGQSQGQFMGKLGVARQILQTVRQDRLDVRSYIQGTVRPDIMALRQQLVKQEKTNNSAGTSEEGTTTAENAQ